MDPAERSLLERTYKLAEENNQILRGIRRSNRFATIMRALYWVAIIALSFGAYYLIQPYLQATLSAYDDIKGNLQGAQSNLNSLQNTADSLRNLLK